MHRFRFFANSEADTERLGAAMARTVRPADVIALNGDVGAGKTRLVRAMVAALDGTDALVNSPTFVIVQRYDVRVPVNHIDAYRLADSDEFLALGAEELLGGDGVCLIEWAERVADVLPAGCVQIDIAVTSPTSRRFEFSGNTERAADFVARIERALSETDT